MLNKCNISKLLLEVSVGRKLSNLSNKYFYDDYGN